MSKKSRSKLWFLVHSWLALPIWFFVLIVCVTGTLAVVSQEIVWLANPEMRASKPSDDATLLSYDQVRAAIKQAQPLTQVQSIVRPDESHFALEAKVTYPDGARTPSTSTLTAVSSRDRLRRSISGALPAPCMAGGWCRSPTATAGAGTWCLSSACRCSPHW